MVPAAPWRRSPPDSWLRRGSHQSAQIHADPGVVKQEQQTLQQAVPSVSLEQKEPSAPPSVTWSPKGKGPAAGQWIGAARFSLKTWRRKEQTLLHQPFPSHAFPTKQPLVITDRVSWRGQKSTPAHPTAATQLPEAGGAQSTSSLPPIASELLSSTGHGVGHKELEFSSQQVTFSRGDSVPAAGISTEGGLAASSFCPAVRLSICKCSCTEYRAAS